MRLTLATFVCISDPVRVVTAAARLCRDEAGKHLETHSMFRW
eukprot:COSAG06_NODE_65965_length_255_cov_1.243590_1_plen_41_part_10